MMWDDEQPLETHEAIHQIIGYVQPAMRFLDALILLGDTSFPHLTLSQRLRFESLREKEVHQDNKEPNKFGLKYDIEAAVATAQVREYTRKLTINSLFQRGGELAVFDFIAQEYKDRMKYVARTPYYNQPIGIEKCMERFHELYNPQ